MDDVEGSNSERWPLRRQTRTSEATTYERSVLNMSIEGRMTHVIVNRNRVRPLNSIPGTSTTVFDNTSPCYNWLHVGWLAEERRIVSTGRLYRYYYDPLGQMYYTRQEVEQIFADIDKCMNEKNRLVINLD